MEPTISRRLIALFLSRTDYAVVNGSVLLQGG